LLLLVIIFPVYSLGKTWWNGQSLAKDLDLTQVNFQPADYARETIVVLGAAQFDGKPGPILKERLKTALAAYKKSLAPAIITVGDGAPGDRTTEAASGKKWLIRAGVPKSRIIAVAEGRDTYASTLAYSATMKSLDLESALIVTDPYHCLRATTMAKDLGIDALCLPTLAGSTDISHSSLRYLLRESGAYLAYVTLGRRGILIGEETIDRWIPQSFGKAPDSQARSA
jgi:vancomycin permeability regulator SanA